MGLGCLNPGKCNCNGICWNCPVPLSYTINCTDPCFSALNGVHTLAQADFENPSLPCVGEAEVARTALYHHYYTNPPFVWHYEPMSALRSGDFLHVSLCDGSPIDQTVNPRPDTVDYENVDIGDVLVWAKRSVAILSPNKVRVELLFYVARQSFFEFDFTEFPPQQLFYSRDYNHEFVFELELINCGGGVLLPISTTVLSGADPGFTAKLWGLGNPAPSTGPLATTASDFTVSIQMP